MSMAAYRWAKGQNLPPLQKFVLVMIADHYNEKQHRSWPSRSTLAQETGISVRTVTRAIQDLERSGLIAVEPWLNIMNGSQLANRYCLPLYDQHSRRALKVPVRVQLVAGSAKAWEDVDSL